ncbi:MAG: hypothetical protein M3O71_19500 [Bacteroidota bacterium]|nr:hypothetical protein [Bacteroidota bacterium]
MTTTNLFNNRLAIRNLAIVTILSLAYLFGKHLQANSNAPHNGAFKIRYTSNQHIPATP